MRRHTRGRTPPRPTRAGAAARPPCGRSEQEVDRTKEDDYETLRSRCRAALTRGPAPDLLSRPYRGRPTMAACADSSSYSRSRPRWASRRTQPPRRSSSPTTRAARSGSTSSAEGVDAEWYAALLRAAPHGDEISTVTVTIVSWEELRSRCGRGAAGCYNRNRMVVPAEQSDESAHTRRARVRPPPRPLDPGRRRARAERDAALVAGARDGRARPDRQRHPRLLASTGLAASPRSSPRTTRGSRSARRSTRSRGSGEPDGTVLAAIEGRPGARDPRRRS